MQLYHTLQQAKKDIDSLKLQNGLLIKEKETYEYVIISATI